MTHLLLHRISVTAVLPGDRLVDARLKCDDGESPEVVTVERHDEQVIVQLDDGALVGLWADQVCDVARPVWAEEAA